VDLRADETAPGRAFTEPARSAADLATVATIRASLIRRIGSGLGGGTWSDDGETHWLVVPSVAALTAPAPAVGVGFFGQARDEVDHTPILDFEQDLLARAADLPGLLAYLNVQLRTGQWGNLVVFAGPDDPSRLHGDATHLQAVSRTPAHYRSVRLHRLRFPDGPLSPTPPIHESTLLLDFSQTPAWRALREGAGTA
jgi:hypothetical protein